MSAWKWERVDGKLVRPWGFRTIFWVFVAALVGVQAYDFYVLWRRFQ